MFKWMRGFYFPSVALFDEGPMAKELFASPIRVTVLLFLPAEVSPTVWVGLSLRATS